MKRKTRITAYSAAAGVGLISALWLLGKRLPGYQRISGPPTTKRLSYRILQPGEEASGVRFGTALALVDGEPVGLMQPLERNRTFTREVQAVWKLRRMALPKDASGGADTYSKEQYWLPFWVQGNPDMLTQQGLVQNGNGAPVDEFGRPFPGHYGEADNSLWGQTLGGLLKNPLFKTVAIAALVASGPYGAAVYGAYTLWQNRGKKLTVQNVAMTAGRAAAVSQCGEACGAAFDFGAGVAAGKSYDKAAESALVEQISPEQRAYYTQGKKNAHKLGL